jgi:hypothetical protein
MTSRRITTCTMLRFASLLGALGLMAAGVGAQPSAQTASPPVPPMLAKPAPAPKTAADKPIWSQLSAAQQTALEPLRAEWDPMEGVRKQKWLELANRFSAMKPEEQQRVHERMREWIRLTPAQRKLARQNYTQLKTIAPDQKTATWESYKQLPDEQKQKLAEQAQRKPITNLPTAKSPQRGTAPVLKTPPPVPAPTTAPVPATGVASASAPAK